MAVSSMLQNQFDKALGGNGVRDSGLSSLSSLTLVGIVGLVGGGDNEGWKISEGNRKHPCRQGLNTLLHYAEVI